MFRPNNIVIRFNSGKRLKAETWVCSPTWAGALILSDEYYYYQKLHSNTVTVCVVGGLILSRRSVERGWRRHTMTVYTTCNGAKSLPSSFSSSQILKLQVSSRVICFLQTVWTESRHDVFIPPTIFVKPSSVPPESLQTERFCRSHTKTQLRSRFSGKSRKFLNSFFRWGGWK